MTKRVEQILTDLERTRENLLALSDDIWLAIDHNDNTSLQEGFEFKRAYNERMADFDRLASELSGMIQQFASVRIEQSVDEPYARRPREENERIVQELNREEPHALTENFSYKRPYGFVLQGQGAKDLVTWRKVYQLVCQMLAERDGDRFRSLTTDPAYETNRGNRSVSDQPEALRNPLEIMDGVYVESNLSANSIRDCIVRLLNTYQIPVTDLVVYLREDRDADDVTPAVG